MPPIDLYLWVSVDAGKTLSNWSLSIYATEAGVLDFGGVFINNPSKGGVPRFEYVFDSSAASLSPLTVETSPADRIDGFQAFTIDPSNGTGLHAANADDNAGSAAWLAARIPITLVAGGMSEIFLEVGSRGMNNLGESSALQSITLGRSDDIAYLASQHATLAGDSADVTLVLHSTTADFNLDGVVDSSDFTLWQTNWGIFSGADCTMGDADSDADVDGFDLLAWQANFAPGAAPSVPIPIPAAGGLGLLASALGSARRCRRDR